MMTSVEDQLYRWYMKKNDLLARKLERMNDFEVVLVLQFKVTAASAAAVRKSSDVVGDYRIDSRHKISNVAESTSPVVLPRTDDLPALVVDIYSLPENTLVTWSVDHPKPHVH